MRFKKAVAELILAVMIGAFYLAIVGHFMRLFDGALFIGCRVLVIIGTTVGGPILAVGTYEWVARVAFGVTLVSNEQVSDKPTPRHFQPFIISTNVVLIETLLLFVFGGGWMQRVVGASSGVWLSSQLALLRSANLPERGITQFSGAAATCWT